MMARLLYEMSLNDGTSCAIAGGREGGREDVILVVGRESRGADDITGLD